VHAFLKGQLVAQQVSLKLRGNAASVGHKHIIALLFGKYGCADAAFARS
jgi:hypothetical protein